MCSIIVTRVTRVDYIFLNFLKLIYKCQINTRRRFVNSPFKLRHVILRLLYVPGGPAAPFARNVACHGILVKYFSVFKIYYVLLVFLRFIKISVTSRVSDKPVCHGGAKVRYGCPRSITIISMFCYGLLRSVAVSCVLTKV